MTSPLPERPLIKRHLLATTINQDEVFVLAEDRAWLWKSRGLGSLLPNLNGTRTLSDLFELVGSQVSPPEIIYLLSKLHDLGLLAEGSTSPLPDWSDAELAFWHASGVDNDRALERVRRSQIR